MNCSIISVASLYLNFNITNNFAFIPFLLSYAGMAKILGGFELLFYSHPETKIAGEPLDENHV